MISPFQPNGGVHMSGKLSVDETAKMKILEKLSEDPVDQQVIIHQKWKDEPINSDNNSYTIESTGMIVIKLYEGRKNYLHVCDVSLIETKV